MNRREWLKSASALTLVSVAEMPTAEAFLHGSSPAPPAPALAAGYTKRVFFDDFLSSSTIDLTNTKVPGFNWYVNNTWPNAAGIGGNQTTLAASTPTPAAGLSVSNSILTITQDPSPSFGQSLNTACTSASAPNYIGTVFGGGAFFEASILCSRSSAGNPAFWTAAIEFLAGSQAVYAELDFDEFFSNPSGSQKGAVHGWDNSVNPATDNFAVSNPLPPSFDAAFHRIGFLWIPMSRGGGTGSFGWYFDGVQVGSSLTYTTTGSPTPWGIADTQHFPIILGTGSVSSASMSIDWVAVWQIP